MTAKTRYHRQLCNSCKQQRMQSNSIQLKLIMLWFVWELAIGIKTIVIPIHPCNKINICYFYRFLFFLCRHSFVCLFIVFLCAAVYSSSFFAREFNKLNNNVCVAQSKKKPLSMPMPMALILFLLFLLFANFFSFLQKPELLHFFLAIIVIVSYFGWIRMPLKWNYKMITSMYEIRKK